MCFHAYSGRGYNPEFIAKMDNLKNLFLKHPKTLVKVISEPDEVCKSCPNLSREVGCIADGTDDQELRVRNRDLKVMRLTGITEGEILSIRDAFRKVEGAISGSMLDEICKDCQWLPNSSCKLQVNMDFWSAS